MNQDLKTGQPDIEPSSRWFTVILPAIIYIAALAIGIVVYLATPTRTVTACYETAATQWLQGDSVYADSSQSGHGFLYLPHAAILHIPYSVINALTTSVTAGNVVWRIVSWFVFALGSWRLTRSICEREEAVQWRVALIGSLLGLSCLRIGQSTLLMTGLMMLCIEAWQMQRINRAAILVALAVAVKPLALVLGLLLFAISRPLRLPMIVGALGLVAFPFLTQSPGYVVAQYRDCFTMLQTASDLGNNFQWAQLFGMLNVFGISTDPSVQTITRLVAAIMVLVLALFCAKTLDRRRQALWLWTLVAAYLMLFNPRTENSTYCILGPLYGLFIGQLLTGDPKVSWRCHLLAFPLFIAALLTAGSYEIGKHFTPEGHAAIWLAPLCALGFLAFLGPKLLSEVRGPKSQPDKSPVSKSAFKLSLPNE